MPDRPLSEIRGIGFIGLGVMGEPMCRHLVQKRGRVGVERVIGHDLSEAPLARLEAHGLQRAGSLSDIAASADLILVSLPGGAELEALCLGDAGLLEMVPPGRIVVDLGTSPVGLTRDLQARFAAKGVAYADAPVARTRAAAEAGTLVVLVGGDQALFARLRPILGCFASDVVACGGIGAGQVVKQMNNMVLFQTVTALAEALSVARRAGVDGALLFEAMTKGSGDSFALRNHGHKALLPGDFPARAFSTRYACKDLGYAIELARQVGLHLTGAETTADLFDKAIESGFGDDYFPAVVKVIDRPAGEEPA